jgi:DNA-binding SARP family transcriptional activator
MISAWSERLQARLLPAILKAMIVLIDRCRRTADTRTMERLADRMIALDQLSEDAVRAKMESRAFDGDRLTALRVFEEWKEMLARDLGAVPSDLVEGIASGSGDGAGSARRTTAFQAFEPISGGDGRSSDARQSTGCCMKGGNGLSAVSRAMHSFGAIQAWARPPWSSVSRRRRPRGCEREPGSVLRAGA